MNNKVAIIGSGIAGIATSIRLKAKGFDVTVYEKNSFPGGKLSTGKVINSLCNDRVPNINIEPFSPKRFN